MFGKKTRDKTTELETPEPNRLSLGMARFDDVAPSSIEIEKGHVVVSDDFFTVLCVTDFPSQVENGWMDDVYDLGEDTIFSMFIDPLKKDKFLKDLEKCLKNVDAEIFHAADRGERPDPAATVKQRDLEELQDRIHGAETNPFTVAMYAGPYASSLEGLKEIETRVVEEFGAKSVTTRKAKLRMKAGFLSLLPYCHDELASLGRARVMDTEGVAALLNFGAPSVNQPGGIIFGINPFNRDAVIYNPWTGDGITKPSKFSSVMCGSPGGGKSMTTKIMICQHRTHYDARVKIIDVKSEYVDLALALGGEVMEIGTKRTASFINPFHLARTTDPEQGRANFTDKLLFLSGLVDLMASTLDENVTCLDVVAHNSLDAAIKETYARKGITEDCATHDRVPPLMKDLSDVLEEMAADGDAGADSVHSYLKLFVGQNTYGGLFDRDTTALTDNPLLVFDLSDLRKQLWPVAMYVIANHVWNDIVNGELWPTLLVVDEAWQLLKHPKTGEFLSDVVRLSRQYYAGIHVVTQNLRDFVKSDYGKDLIAGSAMKWVFHVEDSEVPAIVEAYDLNSSEEAFVRALKKGEALLTDDEGRRLPVDVKMPDYIYNLANTDPREKAEAAGAGGAA